MRLFKRIRLRLLQEQKIRNYLLYAVGEVLLIVIGIIIAVQINDWNEHAKIQRSEDRILLDMQVLFTSNQNQIDSSIKKNQKIKEGLILRILKTGPNVEIPKEETLRILSKIDHESLSLAYDGTANKLSQNELLILKNEELKDDLSAFTMTFIRYKNQEGVLSSLALALRQVHQKYISLLHAEINKAQEGIVTTQEQFPSDYLGWLRDRDHQNKAVECKWKIDLALTELKDLQSQNKRILEIIEREARRFKSFGSPSIKENTR